MLEIVKRKRTTLLAPAAQSLEAAYERLCFAIGAVLRHPDAASALQVKLADFLRGLHAEADQAGDWAELNATYVTAFGPTLLKCFHNSVAEGEGVPALGGNHSRKGER